MALSPNVVVVAPGELITATHLNNIRANLDRIDNYAAAKRMFTGTPVGYTGTADTVVNTVVVPARPSAGTILVWAFTRVDRFNGADIVHVTIRQGLPAVVDMAQHFMPARAAGLGAIEMCALSASIPAAAGVDVGLQVVIHRDSGAGTMTAYAAPLYNQFNAIWEPN